MQIGFVFAIEIILLYFLSKHLIFSVHQVFLKISRREKLSIYLFAILFLPGTFVHELSHFLAAKLFFVPTGEFTILPVIEDGRVRLGSVAIAKTDPFRRFLIGVAPIYLGALSLLLILYYLSTQSEVEAWQTVFVAGLVSFEIGNTMFSSKKDIEGAVELLLGVVLLIGILYIAGVDINFPQWMLQLAAPIRESLLIAIQILIIPLLVDLIVISILRAFLFLFFGGKRH